MEWVEGMMYVGEGVLKFVGSDMVICDGWGMRELVVGEGVGVGGYVLKVLGDCGYGGMYGVGGEEGIRVGVGVDVGGVGRGEMES